MRVIHKKAKKNTRRSPSTVAKQKAFLKAHIEGGGIVLNACQLTGISRMSHYRWLESDPVYTRAFERASKEAVMRVTRVAERGVIEKAKAGNRLCREFIKQYWGKPVLQRILRGESPFGVSEL